MTLTPMRYKSYTWPHNPRVYSIDFRRTIAVHQLPFQGYQLQDLGRSHRVMRGEGEFVGEGAYAEFQKLARVFYGGGPGTLVHPLWQTASAYFAALRLEQAPRPDYVRYSFEFWEENVHYSGLVTKVAEARTDPEQTEAAQSKPQWQSNSIPLAAPPVFGWTQAQAMSTIQPVYHKMAEGENLWTLSARYGLSAEELVELNPQIKNPNLIDVGQEVRVQ